MAGIVGGGVALIGGLLGAHAAGKAADQQSAAIQQGIDFQKQVYGQGQANLNPFIGGGTNALAAISQLLGLPAPAGSTLGPGNALTQYSNFIQTPFYQFPLSQGLATLNASGAAHGLTLSGGQAKGLQAYGQGYASQNFNSYIGALANLANLGQGSASALVGAGNNAAQTGLAGQTALGNAGAAGTVGSTNQIKNALGAIPQITSSLPGAGNSLWNTISGLFGGGGGNYGAYSSAGNALADTGAGSPAALQTSFGASPNQFVP